MPSGLQLDFVESSWPLVLNVNIWYPEDLAPTEVPICAQIERIHHNNRANIVHVTYWRISMYRHMISKCLTWSGRHHERETEKHKTENCPSKWHEVGDHPTVSEPKRSMVDTGPATYKKAHDRYRIREVKEGDAACDYTEITR